MSTHPNRLRGRLSDLGPDTPCDRCEEVLAQHSGEYAQCPDTVYEFVYGILPAHFLEPEHNPNGRCIVPECRLCENEYLQGRADRDWY